jgi:hypothetical protein
VKYRIMSDAKDGRVKAITPHAAPNTKDVIPRSAIEKDRPTPSVVRTSEVMTIVLVDGKATRLIKL